MLVILSPSKSVTNRKPSIGITSTQALFAPQTEKIVKKLRSLSLNKLQEELEVSKSLAKLNYERYQQWNKLESRSAVWLYGGDVYNGLDAFTMTKSDVMFAQKHLAIISGLYGVVRPLDAIKPYRLEMKLALKGSWGKNLYEAWGDTVAGYIKDSGEDTILMCASKEYAKAVTRNSGSNVKIVTPRFLQQTADGYKEKGLFSKYARGALTRFVIDNRIESVNELHSYTKDGFSYSAELSSDNELAYIIPEDFTLKGRFTQA